MEILFVFYIIVLALALNGCYHNHKANMRSRLKSRLDYSNKTLDYYRSSIYDAKQDLARHKEGELFELNSRRKILEGIQRYS